jgi:D-serine deaminase-like pyridoxal phosphate-dependent protein
MQHNDLNLTCLITPALILDEAKMLRNIQRLADKFDGKGVVLRPHLKTIKSLDVGKLVLNEGRGPATVSTLREAEIFAAAGVHDITYAVGISPQKLEQVVAIRRSGCDLSIILDSVEQAVAVAETSHRLEVAIPALIELDCDGHRGGIGPSDPLLIEIGKILHNGNAELRGVLAHAGESYEFVGRKIHAALAERERLAAVTAAETLRASGLPCRVVSIGSSPTAHAVENLEGVSEVRAGVYVFFDLVQAGIEVCTLDDIALSVLTTVIGHQHEKNWILIDAGWMALSQDRGTAKQAVDQGYGIVCDEAGNILPDLIVGFANQEHGIITRRSGNNEAMPELPVGTRLRILPNHACATATQFNQYNVVPAKQGQPLKQWPRFRGW